MALKTSTWSMKRLGSMLKNGKINMDIAIQRRANIWDKQKKSLLIHSILANKPIPIIYANVAGDVNEVIDGKQRISTVLSFVNNKFALTNDIPDFDDIKLAGMKFSNLPQELQEKILNSSFEISKYENLSEEEIEDMFFRLNNGASLKSIENTRVLLGTKNMREIAGLSEHPFFVEKSNVSNNRYTDQETMLQIMMLIKNSDTGFSSKEIRLFVQDIRKTELPQDLIDTSKDILDYLNQGFINKKKYLKKLHLPMVVSIAMRAKENNIEPEYFASWVEEFFTNLKEDSEYYQASQSGSAKKENVQKRLSYITSAFNEYFNLE